jgi:hypothetical protein
MGKNILTKKLLIIKYYIETASKCMSLFFISQEKAVIKLVTNALG